MITVSACCDADYEVEGGATYCVKCKNICDLVRVFAHDIHPEPESDTDRRERIACEMGDMKHDQEKEQ